MYIVSGGIYTDTTFRTLEPNTQEKYGPFSTYNEAREKWSAAARQNLDICCHRLFITTTRKDENG